MASVSNAGREYTRLAWQPQELANDFGVLGRGCQLQACSVDLQANTAAFELSDQVVDCQVDRPTVGVKKSSQDSGRNRLAGNKQDALQGRCERCLISCHQASGLA